MASYNNYTNNNVEFDKNVCYMNKNENHTINP